MAKNGTIRYIKDILHREACKRHLPIAGDVFMVAILCDFNQFDTIP